MKNVMELMQQLRRDRFYGSLEIKYRGGRIVLLTRTQTYLLPDNDRDEGVLKWEEPMMKASH